ncbi:hypothetical protein IGI04_031842 [Brassica rapa subsp. trilocularis]|uniref:Uncharacterized protein n=1 Tax=Brassica rapa subsp. trilocularis TaxID=1813537 RepID=A0ABQ7LUR0_BRACM|nr:hypothetical protein IGI04_031842 [Brassica rapa subsp. trilocularis]
MITILSANYYKPIQFSPILCNMDFFSSKKDGKRSGNFSNSGKSLHTCTLSDMNTTGKSRQKCLNLVTDKDHFLKSYLTRRLFGKKSASKSNPATPPHPAAGRSPPPSYLSNKRAETEYDFPISREQRTYPKQPASERVPNSHPRPPVYGYGTPERRERKERMSYEPETNAPSSPFHPSGNRTPERRRKSSEYSREHQDRMYEADTRSNASPFHPFKSPSPSPYHTSDRRIEHDADHYEAMYEPEANTMFQNRAPGSPFRQAGNRSPSPYRTPDRQQSEDLYERDGDVTPRNSSPPSPFHPAANRSPPPQSHRTPDRRGNHPDDEQDGEVTPRTSSPPSPFHPAARRSPPPPQPYRTPDRRRNHPDNQQSEEVYERDGEVTPRNSSPPSPFHPAASRSPPPQPYRTPDRRSNNHNDEQMEAMYEPDGYVMRQDSPPRSPLHGGAYYSSSDDDNHSTYLFPEIGTPTRSIPVSANTTPVHHNYQIIAAETYEQEKQYEPPELADESQSFSIQEIAKMRGLKEESQSMISESYVSVANYRVKSSVAETLQAIISKHGDIAASSKLQSNVTRSYYLESLAAVVMELRTSGLKDLTKTRVAEMAAVVKDMESVKIEVTWLKKAVAELGEAVECAGEYEAAKAEREACERDMKARKGEMEEMREELGKREKEIRECRERVTAVAGKLGQLEMKGSRLSKNLEMFHSKVDKFQGEAVLLHSQHFRPYSSQESIECNSLLCGRTRTTHCKSSGPKWFIYLLKIIFHLKCRFVFHIVVFYTNSTGVLLLEQVPGTRPVERLKRTTKQGLTNGFTFWFTRRKPEEAEKRPTMSEVVDMLMNNLWRKWVILKNLVLVLDMEVAKLTNIQAFEAAQIVGISVDAHIETELPRSLAEIVWYIYTFQLKLKNFNFTSKHQNLHHFSRFSLARACICASLCCAKVSEAVQPEVVANRSYAKVNKTCCVTEAPSIFDGSLAGRTSSCCFGRRNHATGFFVRSVREREK